MSSTSKPPLVLKDANGRFAAGNNANPFGSKVKRPEVLHRALLSVFDKKSMRELGEVLKNAALKGEAWAVKLCIEHTIGQPEKTLAKSKVDALVAKAEKILQQLTNEGSHE